MNLGRIVVARLKRKNNFLRYSARLLITSGNIFRKYYDILNENGFVRLLSHDELSEVFDLIKPLPPHSDGT